MHCFSAKLIFFFLALSFCFAGSLESEPVSRLILALYDSGQGQSPGNNHIHTNAEVILNYLGCRVDYHDIQSGLPDEASMQKYRGVLTWFYSNAMQEPEAYLSWAARQVQAGRKFVIFGNLGAFRDRDTLLPVRSELLQRSCRELGFVPGSVESTDDLTRIELMQKVPDMVEFERRLDYEITDYQHFRAVSPQSQIYLTLQRRDVPDSKSDLVFTSPAGGFAAAPYVIHEDEETFKRQWRLNPFAFFNEAFALHDLPRPDVTTLNGMRVWTSHIDGDAFISRSQWRPESYCAEVIRDEILKKYRWPVSVSVVVGEVERAPKFIEIARSVFAIDWVEAASHAYSHPYYWDERFAGKHVYDRHHLDIPGYTFDVEQEIAGSVAFINSKLLPPGKQVKQFFWTGNCQPTPAALKLCEKLNLPNINGGDSIFDRQYPSYTHLAPLGVEVGGYRQVYAPNANENIYTNDWQGPFYTFRQVLETFERTESPRRIKPINIYYHYYSGERHAALAALRQVIDATITQPVAPMFISDYLAMVQGFYSTTLERNGEHTWTVSDFGACRTLRFDDIERAPDLRQSKNVLGFYREGRFLYVHLDEATHAEIVLTESAPTAVYLARASHKIRDWQSSDAGVSFKTAGFGKGEFVIANLHQNRDYVIRLRSETEQQLKLKSDINGQLAFGHPMRGELVVEINAVK